ncbi:hypothetical protein LXL04_001473 [Taraxacum kok-saghyz]
MGRRKTLTDFSSVLTEFNSIWSDFWSDSDPNPTRSTTRVFKPLNPNFSHFSEKRSRPFFVLHIAISGERSGDLRPAPTRPCPSSDLAATHTIFSGLFRRKTFFLPTRLLRRRRSVVRGVIVVMEENYKIEDIIADQNYSEGLNGAKGCGR